MGVVDDFQLSFYEEVSKISDGASGIGSEVCLVRDTRDDRLYVKKILKVSEEKVYKVIMDYAKKNPIGGKLVGVPEIFTMVTQDEKLIVVEEYINHPTLRKVMESEALTMKELILMFKEICQVLNQLHTLNPPIIHRDIKPDNIMVNMNAVRGIATGPKVYVIDWNAAREYSYSKERDTQLMGTIEFAAPEQLGYGQSDVRTDIFGLGATLEYCIKEMETKSISGNHSYMWSGLKAMVEKAKSLAPNDRYGSDEEMMLAFDELLGIRGTGVTSSKAKRDYTLPGFRTKKLWKMLVAVLGYILMFDMAKDAKLNEYTGVYLTYSKVVYYILLLCHVFWFSNYLGVQDNFKWIKGESKVLRILGHISVLFVMWLIWAMLNDLPNMLGLIK